MRTRSGITASALNFYKRYREGLSEFGSLIKDHEEKMEAGDHCAYCGADVSLRENRSTDHLIPKSALKLETGDNAVRVCRACNTSKNATDLLAWFAGRPEKFPPLLVFRIYLKLAYAYCERERMLDLPWPDSQRADLPFRMDLLYRELPPLGELRLRVVPC